MSRHEGVSCDSCLKSNFTGRRYKCLICYDYDLCADCYEDGATSTRHLNEHPMQCILTRADIELYFGGELLSTEQPQSFTCPYCKKMGFSDQTLADHVNNEHTETGLEVVCPVCAGSPGGDPNLVTDDFAGHLTLGHRSGPRELMSFLDEPSAIRHGGGVRRIQPGRALGGPRSRRTNMHFSSSSGLANLSPSGRESVDPIAELLSQLSGVRRTGGSSQQSSQLQQLQMQIQLERQQQASATRQQLERFPRRNHPMVSTSNVNSSMAEVVSGNGGGSSAAGGSGNISVSSGPPVGLIGSQSGIGVATMNSRNGGVAGEIPLSSSGMHVASFGNANPNLFGGLISGIASGINNIHLANNVLSANAPPSNTAGGNSNDSHSQFLLPKFLAPSLADEQLAQIEKDRADRSQFVQALMLSTLSILKLDGSDSANDQDDHSDSTEVNKNSNSDMSNNNNETNSEVTTQTPTNNQVDQQQQTNPDDFLEEYSYQQATTPQPQPQHPTQPNYNRKKQQSSTASATAAAVVLERRGKPPPPSSGQQQQQQPTPQGRAASKVVSATKEIPDTR